MIAIVDYGVGNLFSLSSSLDYLGLANTVTADADVLAQADRIILPGVGAFGDAMDKLRHTGLAEPIRALALRGKPLLGICLGMQLLFDSSEEYGTHEGLGLIPGTVVSLKDALEKQGFSYKVPHIGWNSLHLCRPDNPLMKGTSEGDFVYYVHSFYAVGCEEDTVANSEYGIPVTGAVNRGSVYGTQFHPEKSGSVGLRILRAFAEL